MPKQATLGNLSPFLYKNEILKFAKDYGVHVLETPEGLQLTGPRRTIFAGWTEDPRLVKGSIRYVSKF